MVAKRRNTALIVSLVNHINQTITLHALPYQKALNKEASEHDGRCRAAGIKACYCLAEQLLQFRRKPFWHLKTDSANAYVDRPTLANEQLCDTGAVLALECALVVFGR